MVSWPAAVIAAGAGAATVLLSVLVLSAGGATAASTPIYQNRSYSFAERAADLVSRMTLSQKAGELNSSLAAAIPGLGVNAWSWWNEAAHGVAEEGTTNDANPTYLVNTTSYPVSLSAASTWDPSLMYREAGMISDEAREVEQNNTENMDFYAPVVNLMRDPRWGRSDETFSEDPFLTTQMADAYVEGMQGENQHGQLLRQGNGYYKALSTLKHYTANNSEFNRLDGNSQMDDRTLEEYYTDQFRQIVQQAHPGAIMSSYNEVQGTPSPVNVKLIDTLARETWGFGGYFTSDCDAIYEVQAGHDWIPPNSTVPVNAVTRHAYALSAGEDLNCNEGYNDGNSYANELPSALGTHTLTDTLSQNDLDVSAERLFTARMELGEFDAASGSVPWVNQARERVPQGTWVNSDANHAETETPARLQMAREVGDAAIVLLKNSSTATGAKLLPIRVPASGTPFTVLVTGYFANPAQLYLGDYSSEQGTFGTANEINPYQGIKSAIQAIDPAAVVEYCPGVEGGDEASELTEVDPACPALASKANDVIVVAGTDASTGTEGQDRPNVDMPGAQDQMIEDMAAQNPNTIVYTVTDGMVDVRPWINDVSAVLWSSYNGEREGQSLADVLTGRYDPSGRLPFTWYQGDEDLPPMADYAIRPGDYDGAAEPGRTYMYYSGPVSYPFGYGLSYTRFRFSDLSVEDSHPDANGTVRISADVTNSGPMGGGEVAELYVNQPDAPASRQRPIKRLEGFQKVFLGAGETSRVNFTVKVPSLDFFDQSDNRWEVDDGAYMIQLSTSSAAPDVQLEQPINVTGTLTPKLSVITAKPTMPSDAAQDIHDRLIFPAKTTVLPNLTVAMSDDTLYGYVTKGASRSFPAGMTFTYSSDHPESVRVLPDGTIRTTSNPGPATITVTAHYQGATQTGQFVIDNTGSSNVGY
jgi:beta-glucosidase